MTTVSFDVGIRNLAVCVLNQDKEIVKWDVLNLLQEVPVEVVPCCMCKKKSHYRNVTNTALLYCKVHATTAVKKNEMFWWSRWGSKKQDLIDACPEWLKNDGDKTVKQLRETMESHSLESIPNPVKKKTLDVSLIDIGRTMTTLLDSFFIDISDVMHVLIENQISPIANRMKTLQGMLTEYFIIRFPNTKIHNISSSNKLRSLGKTKETYAQHKTAAVTLCRESLQGRWLEWFDSFKKKDDLADSYLQGIWFTEKKMA